MSEVYTVKAKTVADAMQLASKMYGGAGKELTYDIVSTEKKGFLGIGCRDAEIHVTVKESVAEDLSDMVDRFRSSDSDRREDSERGSSEKKERCVDVMNTDGEFRKETKNQKLVSDDEPAVKKDSSERKEQPVENKREQAPAQKKEKSAPVKKEQRTVSKKDETSSSKPQTRKTENTRGSSKAEEKSVNERGEERNEPALKVGVREDEMNFVLDFVNRMIAGMKLSAVASPADPSGKEYIREEGAELYPAVEITGEDTGVLIGHHGETLDAIQYLANLALFRRSGSPRGREHTRITIDIENYREKREDTLRALARRMAARAVKYKRNVFLEPMNPYERRIIHSELQDFEGVSTHSVGADINRKIVITYEGGGRSTQNNRRRGRSSRTNEHQGDTRVGQAGMIDNAAEAASNENGANKAVNSAGVANSDNKVELSTASRAPLPTLDD